MPLLALLYENQLERAEERIRSSQQVVQDPLLIASEALLWAKRGEKRKAQQLLTRALQSKKMLAHTHHTWHVAADAYAVMGKTAPALSLLAIPGSCVLCLACRQWLLPVPLPPP